MATCFALFESGKLKRTGKKHAKVKFPKFNAPGYGDIDVEESDAAKRLLHVLSSLTHCR